MLAVIRSMSFLENISGDTKKGPGCQTIFRRFQGYQCFPAIPSAADFYFIVL